MIKTHDLHAVSCGFKSRKSQWWWRDDHDLNSLLRSPTPRPRTGINNVEYKQKQKNHITYQ